jgi:hypothetical protein
MVSNIPQGYKAQPDGTISDVNGNVAIDTSGQPIVYQKPGAGTPTSVNDPTGGLVAGGVLPAVQPQVVNGNAAPPAQPTPQQPVVNGNVPIPTTKQVVSSTIQTPTGSASILRTEPPRLDLSQQFPDKKNWVPNVVSTGPVGDISYAQYGWDKDGAQQKQIPEVINKAADVLGKANNVFGKNATVSSMLKAGNGLAYSSVNLSPINQTPDSLWAATINGVPVIETDPKTFIQKPVTFTKEEANIVNDAQGQIGILKANTNGTQSRVVLPPPPKDQRITNLQMVYATLPTDNKPTKEFPNGSPVYPLSGGSANVLSQLGIDPKKYSTPAKVIFASSYISAYNDLVTANPDFAKTAASDPTKAATMFKDYILQASTPSTQRIISQIPAQEVQKAKELPESPLVDRIAGGVANAIIGTANAGSQFTIQKQLDNLQSLDPSKMSIAEKANYFTQLAELHNQLKQIGK